MAIETTIAILLIGVVGRYIGGVIGIGGAIAISLGALTTKHLKPETLKKVIGTALSCSGIHTSKNGGLNETIE